MARARVHLYNTGVVLSLSAREPLCSGVRRVPRGSGGFAHGSNKGMEQIGSRSRVHSSRTALSLSLSLSMSVFSPACRRARVPICVCV